MNKVHFPKEARELIQNGMLAELMSKGVHLDSEKVKAIILDNLPQLRVDYNRLANELKGKFHQPRDGENGRDGDRGYQGVDGTPGIDGKHGKNGLDGTNGINGERGPAGKNGKDYHLTRNDKKTITESIKGKIDLEPYLLKMSFNEQVTTLIRNIESGKIKSKRSGGGFNIKDIIGEINKYVGTEDWQTGAAVSTLNDPTGFVNRTDSSISFDNATRTFTVEPVVDGFVYYCKSVKYTKEAAETVTITDTEGIWFIYYDGATLKATQTFVTDLILTNALCAMVYWNADDKVSMLGEERHGLSMSGVTHQYLHDTVGLAYDYGLGLGDILTDEDGDTDSHAQFSVASGEVHDEDIELDINGILSTTGLDIMYLDGVKWRRDTTAGYSVKRYNTGRLAYNNNGTQAEVTNNDFVLCHVFASNVVDGNPFAIQGQAQYTSKRNAREGAVSEIVTLVLDGLPSAEMKPIATVIFQTSNGYDNAVKGRIVSTDDGLDYVDHRTNPLSQAVAAAETVNYGVANTAIQVLKSGDQSSTTSWADLTGWGTPGIIDADFTFADGVTTIVSDGTYNINLIIQAAIATADFSEIQTKMQLDTGSGYADIPGCFDYSPAANQTGFYDGTPATTKTITAQIANFAIELTAGDKIKPLIQHIQTAGLVSTGNARISILRLK